MKISDVYIPIHKLFVNCPAKKSFMSIQNIVHYLGHSPTQYFMYRGFTNNGKINFLLILRNKLVHSWSSHLVALQGYMYLCQAILATCELVTSISHLKYSAFKNIQREKLSVKLLLKSQEWADHQVYIKHADRWIYSDTLDRTREIDHACAGDVNI
jgi:hypothetical protein